MPMYGFGVNVTTNGYLLLAAGLVDVQSSS
jgi:hypothetical protein